MNGKELYDQISLFVNRIGHSNKEVAEAFAKDHRTLQADVVQLCITIIMKAAQMYEEGNYDGRNEYIFSICEKLKNNI